MTNPAAKIPSINDLRKFGYMMSGVLVFFSLISLWRHHYWMFGILIAITGCVFLLPALLNPQWLLPVHKRWMQFALFLGWVNSRIILSLMFYLIFTPISLVQKLIGRDPLARRFHDKQSSYWIDRSQDTYNPKHFERQF